MKNKNTCITISQQTYELLQTLKSCLQLKTKTKMSYNDIISTYVLAGVEARKPEVVQIMKLIGNDNAQQS